MASIRQLTTPNKDGKRPWVVEYSDAEGKRIRYTPKTGLRRDAVAKRTQIEAELARGEHVPIRQSCTVEEAMDMWLTTLDKRVKHEDGLRATTVRNYKTFSELYIRNQLGRVNLTQLTKIRIQAWIDEIAFTAVRSLSRATTRRVVFCLKSILAEALTAGLVARNILTDLKIRYPGRESVDTVIPEKAEIKSILEACRLYESIGCATYLRPFLTTIVFAGLRSGEARGLTWQNVDLDKGVIAIRVAAGKYGETQKPKTKAAIRDVPIAKPLLVELRRWRDVTEERSHAKAKGLVFFSDNDTALASSNPWASFARLQARMNGCVNREGHRAARGAKYDLHALRHVAATLFIESGLPPKRIQKIMGHTSIKMTFDLYGHLFEDEKAIKAAMDKISIDADN